MPAQLALLPLLAACALACGLSPAPPEASLETLDSLVPRARAGDPEALENITPAGAVIPFLSAPFFPGVIANQTGAQDGINVFPAFSEGAPAAYAVTEYWDQFPKVWLQPLYFLVRGFNPSTGGPIFVDGQAIFGVGTGSRFYSSYWQIYYVVVPDSVTKTEPYTSEKAIFDAGFPLAKGALTFCAIGPKDTNLAWTGELAAVGANPKLVPVTTHPLLPDIKLPLRGTAQGWVEGQKIWFVDFGRNRFHVDEHLVVEADVLYKFAVRDAIGRPHLIPIPSVGGAGPQHQPRPPSLVQGVPQFGALWHEYRVVLNPSNGQLPGANHPPAPFIPAAAAGLRALVADSINSTFASTGNTAYGALYTPPPHSSIEAQVAGNRALLEYTMRLAKNPNECFIQPNPAFPAGPCVWLDSQRAIEQNIAEALIFDTQRLSSCPLIYFNYAVIP